jgi:hypothetical protein
MSAISTLYDQLNQILVDNFGTTHKKLVNPYDLTANDDKLLNRGYGFRVSSGLNPLTVLDCMTSIERTIEIILTVVNRGTERDITIREDAEKVLLEDHIKLVKALRVNTDEPLAKLEYVSDNGIESIFDEEINFLAIKSTYNIRYIEE